jgi:carbon-monoxide dehydrogenase medium subunit
MALNFCILTRECRYRGHDKLAFDHVAVISSGRGMGSICSGRGTMKPALFRYYDPASVDDALGLLADWGNEATVLAGGQTLGPMLNLRMVSPGAIIDINRLAALDYRRSMPHGLAIGALTRQATLEDDRTLASFQPLMAAAVPFIAHRAIRNCGTVGGTLAHADPAAEWGGLALALDATLVLRRRGGDRTVLLATFFAVSLRLQSNLTKC